MSHNKTHKKNLILTEFYPLPGELPAAAGVNEWFVLFGPNDLEPVRVAIYVEASIDHRGVKPAIDFDGFGQTVTGGEFFCGWSALTSLGFPPNE